MFSVRISYSITLPINGAQCTLNAEVVGENLTHHQLCTDLDMMTFIDNSATSAEELMDDLLERNGKEVRFYGGQLWQVMFSDIKRAIIMFPANPFFTLLFGTGRDNWFPAPDYPERMRPETAVKAKDELIESMEYDFYLFKRDTTEGDIPDSLKN